MSNELRKKAAEMLLNGATLLSDPCPYCKGVRVMKEGYAIMYKLWTSTRREKSCKRRNY
jgi:Sjogren''s syndrome/scleroderma autoantigen 1 (Autoantigen p27).